MAKRKVTRSKETRRPQTSPEDTEYEPTEEEVRTQLAKTEWGKTFLTEFLANAQMNTLISYLKLRGYFGMFDGLGKIFYDVHQFISWSDEEDLPTALFLGRSCGNFFAAVRLSSSGQLTECYAQLRACLENTLYALTIHQRPLLAKVWLDRHKSDRNRSKCVNSFRLGEILKRLSSEKSGLGKRVKDAYETCIDFGAHPNERSVFPNLEVYEEQGRSKINLHLLNTRDNWFHPCLLLCVDVGISVIEIFSLIYPEEFKQTNVPEKLSTVRATFHRIALGVLYEVRSPAE